ncbi:MULTISPECIES: hypothetical protein [Brucella/Ochrobactrum group]|uniref:Uncharacterized protein n=1 Tax=Brucella tritici TaxID=94626 RepID=A0A6L3Y9T7_9HYPH|nr:MULTISPECIES: hypothetical protein [Brucella/Ochrobactrum group]KAB2680054.1 hypothetical protein F9L08_21895 [Brucella tritici]
MTKNEYDMHGRVMIIKVQSETEAERLELPSLNTAIMNEIKFEGGMVGITISPDDLKRSLMFSKATDLKEITQSGDDIFLKLTKAGQLTTGVRGNGEIGIYMFEDTLDASIIWHDSSGEQRIDLTHDDVKRHFGSFAGIYENPLLALKVIKPEIEL